MFLLNFILYGRLLIVYEPTIVSIIRLSVNEKEVLFMNIQRAKEIAASPVMANVTYEGTPVYIQQVDEQNEKARIYPLDQPEHEQTVPLSELTEHENH